MSKEFKCGSQVFIDDDDHTEELFIEKTFLCISNGNWIREFETGVYRLSQPEHEITTTPDIFLLNTSNFEVFKKGSSYNDPNDNVSWEVKEDFIAFNGWNNNQSDKMTVNKYF